MKKIIATALVAVMILSALAALAIVPAGAADGGDWAVYASGAGYPSDGDGNVDYTAEPEAPTPSYSYTDEGFNVRQEAKGNIGTTMRFNVMSKTPVNLKRGVTMTVKVNEFGYGSDWWHSFSIWDNPNISHGDSSGKYGNGYISLIRGLATKTKVSGGREDAVYEYKFSAWQQCQNFISDQTYYDKTGTALQPGSATAPMTFSLISFGEDLATLGPKVEEDGTYLLTFKIEWDGTSYRVFNCGTEVPQAAINAYLQTRFPDGMAYISYAVSGANTDCVADITITEFNGEKPTGTDSAVQNDHAEPIGDMIDSDTIADDQPALFFNALNENDEFKYTGKVSTSGIKYSVKKDGSFQLTPEGLNPYLVIGPRNSVSYEASDFPYVALLMRNYCTCALTEESPDCVGDETINGYYCAGATLNPGNDCGLEMVYFADEYTDEYGNNYKLFIWDLSEMDGSDGMAAWAGRINKIEYVFFGMKQGVATDLVYSAFFKSEDAAYAFAEDYVANCELCPHNDTSEIPEKPATCSSTGATAGVICNVCGDTIVLPQITPALEHVWEEVGELAPTCDVPGHAAGQQCSLCGKVSANSIDATGHTKSWTYDDNGHWQICLVAGCDYAGEVSAHNGEDVCICGYGCSHENTKWNVTKEPTCTSTGLKVEQCEDCGYLFADNVEEIATVAHVTQDLDAIAPTCTTEGKTAGQVCTVCKQYIVPQETIAALGHTEKVLEGKAASCTEKGLTEGKVCTVCDATIVEQTEIAMTPHTYDDDKDATCNVCNQKRQLQTEAPTSAPKDETNEDKNDGSSDSGKKKGCKGAVGFGAFAIIASVAAAGAMTFKKKED